MSIAATSVTTKTWIPELKKKKREKHSKIMIHEYNEILLNCSSLTNIQDLLHR